MSESALKARITEAMKEAMRARDKERLSTIRLMLSALKQIEVDERADLDDSRIVGILDKMIKQRRESIRQYEDADRQELADIEKAEIVVIQDFMPQQLSEEEISSAIQQAIQETGAESIKDMGKVMNEVRPKLMGRADMGQVSQLVKQLLG